VLFFCVLLSKRAALQALGSLANWGAHKPTLLEFGTPAVVIRAMGAAHSDPPIQASALGVLCSLAFDGANRISIAAQGGILGCIAAMEQHQNDRAVQQAGCKLLRSKIQ
jgi:hypothetical protein